MLQFNVGSASHNLVELKSLLYLKKLDIVILEEDWIHTVEVPFHISGYDWFYFLRVQLRSTSNNDVHGRGISILIQQDHPTLHHELPVRLSLGPDLSTETMLL